MQMLMQQFTLLPFFGMIRAGRGACADCAPHKASRCLRPFRCTTQGLAAPTFQAIFAQGLAIFSAGPGGNGSDFLDYCNQNQHFTFNFTGMLNLEFEGKEDLEF
ncbi:hypothetical protein HUG17_3132 [Dermatophagoides farinae]|uniref:Uncharacterized protein n=1 Tax=Dermatophagoides farinae TaxID=6954 RepID=A0A9D4SED6_DERFA|nr:hypothetical protein HUG17_3132 [Dermatophagoides farinae]